MPVSFDRFDDGKDTEASPGRPLPAAPGLGESIKQNGRWMDRAPNHEAPTRADKNPGPGPAPAHGERDRAIAELAAENAELYRKNADQAKKIAEQDKTIEGLKARVDKAEAWADMTDKRWRAWAKEMANRDDERAARDEARDKREEALIGRINEVERVIVEVRRANDGAAGPSRIEKRASAEGERRHERPRPSKPSDSLIALGTAVSVEALTAAVDPTGPNLLIGAVGIIGASIPWIRNLKEKRDAD